MRTELCERLGIEVPIFAFTHCRDVVVEVSRAGGLGVLGAAGFRPEQLEKELQWIDDQVDGKPYGVDVIMPLEYVDADPKALADMIPEGHRQWLESLMERYGVPPLPDNYDDARYIAADEVNWRPEQSRALLDVAFSHPIKMIVNALGVPPKDLIDRAHEQGVLIGGLCGKPKHAIRQKEAGLDFVIAQGHEAGGHTGEIATMVLTPEVVRAVAPMPVLSAGGIATGQQVAAALALGAQGAWCGSVWLTTKESDVDPLPKRKLIEAKSSDTVRTRMLSGKPARMLRSELTDAWNDPDCPGFLPMPLQGMLIHDARVRVMKFEVEPLEFYPTGQVVGMMNEERSVRDVMFEMISDCVDTLEHLHSLLDQSK